MPGGDPSRSIATVEHVMAALAGCGVDDALVEVDGPEVPILDGSAAPFVFLIDCAGLVSQAAGSAVQAIEVLRPVRVQDGEGPDAAWAELAPSGRQGGWRPSLTIDFPATAIGRQSPVAPRLAAKLPRRPGRRAHLHPGRGGRARSGPPGSRGAAASPTPWWWTGRWC